MKKYNLLFNVNNKKAKEHDYFSQGVMWTTQQTTFTNYIKIIQNRIR